MSEPVTEAGWALLHYGDPMYADTDRAQVLAIEAEARAAALEEARAAVRERGKRLTAGPGQDSEDVTVAWAFVEADAAIDALRERSGG